MPTKSDFDAAVELGEQFQDGDWADYGNYLVLRGKGLRKPALKQLDKFIDIARNWSFEKRWHFTEFLLEHLQGFYTRNNPLPEPLVRNIIRPTLQEATEKYVNDPRPPYWQAMEGIFRWTATSEANDRENLLKTAIARDPSCQAARLTFVNNILSGIGWHQHELPWGYLGLPAEDLQALQEAKEILKESEASSFVHQLELELEAMAATAQQYLSYESSREGLYREWCDQRNLPYVYVKPPPA